MKTETAVNSRTRKAKNSEKRTAPRHPESPKATLRLTNGNGTTRPLDERKREAAYFNYLNEGRPDGRNLEHWLEAEKQLQGH